MNDSPTSSLLLEIFEKEAMPLFPTYFEKIYEKKKDTRNFNVKSPWFDCFHPVALKKGDSYEGTIQCVLPAPRVFWDCWMSIYQLENPKVFYNPSIAAKSILQELEILKLDPSGFVNFEPYHENHLNQVANFNRRNFFLDNPFGCVLGLKICPMIESLCGDMDPYEYVKKNEQVQIEIQKLEEHMIQDWIEKYPEMKNFLIKDIK